MSIYQQLSVVKAYFDDTVNRVASHYGLKEMEYLLLGFLNENPELDSAAEIVRALQTTKSHVSITVKSLVGKGLLVQQVLPGNKKTIHLTVTEQGRELIGASQQFFKEYSDTVWAGFSLEERKMFQSFCDRFYENSLIGIHNMRKMD